MKIRFRDSFKLSFLFHLLFQLHSFDLTFLNLKYVSRTLIGNHRRQQYLSKCQQKFLKLTFLRRDNFYYLKKLYQLWMLKVFAWRPLGLRNILIEEKQKCLLQATKLSRNLATPAPSWEPVLTSASPLTSFPAATPSKPDSAKFSSSRSPQVSISFPSFFGWRLFLLRFIVAFHKRFTRPTLNKLLPWSQVFTPSEKMV